MRVDVRIFALLFAVAFAGVIPEDHGSQNGIESGDVPEDVNTKLQDIPALWEDRAPLDTETSQGSYEASTTRVDASEDTSQGVTDDCETTDGYTTEYSATKSENTHTDTADVAEHGKGVTKNTDQASINNDNVNVDVHNEIYDNSNKSIKNITKNENTLLLNVDINGKIPESQNITQDVNGDKIDDNEKTVTHNDTPASTDIDDDANSKTLESHDADKSINGDKQDADNQSSEKDANQEVGQSSASPSASSSAPEGESDSEQLSSVGVSQEGQKNAQDTPYAINNPSKISNSVEESEELSDEEESSPSSESDSAQSYPDTIESSENEGSHSVSGTDAVKNHDTKESNGQDNDDSAEYRGTEESAKNIHLVDQPKKEEPINYVDILSILGSKLAEQNTVNGVNEETLMERMLREKKEKEEKKEQAKLLKEQLKKEKAEKKEREKALKEAEKQKKEMEKLKKEQEKKEMEEIKERERLLKEAFKVLAAQSAAEKKEKKEIEKKEKEEKKEMERLLKEQKKKEKEEEKEKRLAMSLLYENPLLLNYLL